MRFSIIILSLICNLLAADARSTPIKGSTRGLENEDLSEFRLLGVGSSNNDGKGTKLPKDPKPDKGEGKGTEDEDADEDEPDNESLPTFPPVSSPVQTPTLGPSTTTANPAFDQDDSASHTPIILYPESPTAPSSSPFAPTIIITNPDPPSPPTPPVLTPGTPTSRPGTDPNQPSVSRPSEPAPTVPSPIGIPTDSQVKVPTMKPSALPSSFSSIMPSVATTTVTIARVLLPFDITLEGDADDQFANVDEQLKLSLEFFLEDKFGEVFEGVTSVRLQEDDGIQAMQRQRVQKTFGFEGNANFQNRNVPTVQEVHRAQQSILENFLFELGGILRDNGIALDPTNAVIDGDAVNTADDDIGFPDNFGPDDDKEVVDEDYNSVDDNDIIQATGDRGIGEDDDDDDDAAAIWVGLAIAGFVLVTGLFIVKRRRPNEVEDEELSLNDEENLMVDTSEPKPLTWDGVFRWSSIGYEELEGSVPRPETEFMNVPQLEDREVVKLKSVSQVSPTQDSMVVETFHNNDPRFARPPTPTEDPNECVVH